MLYEELIIKAFKQDEFGTDIGPPWDQIFGLFEDFWNLLVIMQTWNIEVNLEIDWKDLYDFLFGQFSMKNFMNLAGICYEQSNYNVKWWNEYMN